MDQGRPVPPKPEPPFKVVGFHVEGASPSPRPNSLSDALKTGSMSPVMIPPTFQAPGRSPELSPRRISSPSRGAADSATTPFNGGTVATQPASGRRTSQDALRSPMHRVSNPTSPTVLSAPAAMNALASAAPAPSTTSAQTQQQQGHVSPRRPASASPGGSAQDRGGIATVPKGETSTGKAHTPSKPSSSSTSSSAAQGDQSGQQGAGRPQQKEMTKAERRALQEAQRAAKAASKGGSSAAVGGAGGVPGTAASGGGKAQLQKTSSSGSLSRQNTLDGRGGGGGGGDGKLSLKQQKKDTSTVDAAITEGGKDYSHAATSKGAASASLTKPSATIELFAHLPQFKAVTVESVADRAATANVPIECVRLGIQMAEGSIRGANARCAAMLDMFTAAIQSFKTPTGRVFAREFASALNAMVAFLVSCRPLSPAMGNVIKAVKAELGRIATNPRIHDADAKTTLLSFVATFQQEKVQFAREALARQGAARITEGDVILTYARSSTVESVLLAAADAGTKFSVVVVDSRPLLEGRALLTRLLKAGIPCEYVLINGMMSAMSSATKVMLGAGAVFSNGAVLSRVGTAVVAMSANAAHVPVMVCSETYKFHDRVQLDSVTYNELGDPAALMKMNNQSGVALPGSNGVNGNGSSTNNSTAWRENPNLSLLNLEYDTIPAEFVTVVVTEVGVLPPTSVPVVLREYRTDEMV